MYYTGKKMSWHSLFKNRWPNKTKTSSLSIKFGLYIYWSSESISYENINCDKTRCSAVLIGAYKEGHKFESCHLDVTLKLTNT